MPVFVYHPSYDLKWGEHVFPIDKYRLLRDRLVAEGLVAPDELLQPQPVSDADLLLVHQRSYLDRIESLLSNPLAAYFEFEIPISRDLVAAVRCATGGTILACERALAEGTVAVNLSGGFHHAFPDHGEGFCFINDIAVAIRSLQARRLARRFAVIDCDLHQGNGTAAIFEGDPEVFTFSIHQESIYPFPKQRSRLDVGLDPYTEDAAYLEQLEKAVPAILESHHPELVVYLAGADPFAEDQLGELRLTKHGLRRRDLFVLSVAKAMGIPVAVVLGGGYARRTEDVVDIHANTCRVACQVCGPS